MALLRIKRRAQDDPIDVVLLASKKLKTEEKPLSVFRFLATADPEKEDVKEHLDHVKKTIPKKKVTFVDRDVSKITDLLKAENKALLKNKRLKVVNSFRAKHNEEQDGDADTVTIVDVEHATHEESKDSSSSSATSEQYFYDLYYTSNPGDLCDLQLESALSVHEVDEKLLFGDVDSEEDAANDDEDDSNDEDNWRNDYPDEDEFVSEDDEKSSIDEDDMRNAVLKIRDLNIDGEYSSDLSSDHDDEELIYGEVKRHHYYCDSDNELSD